ncbi:VOC family protein [Arenibacter certesii]|uniref:Glyoxalase/fosfomycin resistance/dioxygenase domain-containing protein n=1 Tax=Arenibacter certesii TaxID=228955 RepID=A0A918J3T5_9FLAO|nr:VOC family protein [Arenibacter certesii]GGW46363.1 hypothetical protein GCM10007383_33360 [Arenibacter certesii]
MELGAFSVSLSVKDITASKLFYENLGSSVFVGELDENYLIMKNGNSLIGLFQGMLENKILTFNPGWDENASKLDTFTDVREIEKDLEKKGIPLAQKTGKHSIGPASIVVVDPDGNTILRDQHV